MTTSRHPHPRGRSSALRRTLAATLACVLGGLSWAAPSAAAEADDVVPANVDLGADVAVVTAVGTAPAPPTSGAVLDDAVVAGVSRNEFGGWFATSTGVVHAFGDAPWLGDMSTVALNEPIVAMAATPSGDGYWLVASDGGIFAFGDAGFHGSTGDLPLVRPIVDIATTPSGDGYWLAADDGGVFTFGDARFHGSMGAVHLNQPIAGISPTSSGEGYWLVAHDGGVFTFGDAAFHGSTGASPMQAPVVDLVVPADGQGYWLVSELGDIAAFGGAEAIAGPLAEHDGVVVGAVDQGDGLWLTRNPARPTSAIWQSGGLSWTVLSQTFSTASLAGAAAAVQHNGTLSVLAFRRRGNLVDGPSPGWQMPMTARAVESDHLPLFFGGDIAGAFDRGEIVVGQTTARLRNTRVGDTVTFVGWDAAVHTRTIGAIVPDHRTGHSELLFTAADAATFGFDRPASVWITSIDDAQTLVNGLNAIAVTQPWVGVSSSWDAPRPDGVHSTQTLKGMLGEFEYRLSRGDAIEMEPAWVAANIEVREVPIIGRVRCNRAVFDDLSAALAEIEASGLAPLIDVRDTRRHGGCWVPRRIRGASGGAVSRHAWGLAIDINPASNAWGTLPTMDPRIVEIFRSHGFAWGGTWTRPDGMHFEWVGT